MQYAADGSAVSTSFTRLLPNAKTYTDDKVGSASATLTAAIGTAVTDLDATLRGMIDTTGECMLGFPH